MPRTRPPRRFATVTLARTLKSRGYAVTLTRAKGPGQYTVLQGLKRGKSGKGHVSVTASGKGRKLERGWPATIHRNSGTGSNKGWSRVIGGKGPRTAAQRAASIANLRKGRPSSRRSPSRRNR